MFVYLSNIFITILCASSKKTIKAGNKIINKRAIMCIVFSFFWILISGLRGVSVGADTRGYGYDFVEIVNTPWPVLWNNVLLKMSSVSNMLEGNLFNKDPGFKLITKCISIIAPTYQLYLIVVAVIFMSSLGRFLYKNTSNPFLGFMIFDCLFYSFYALTGIRQTLATALIVLCGYDYIKERKLIKFLIVAGIAFLIHKSSLCFVPFYFLCRVKVNKLTVGIFSLIIVGAFVFRYQMMNVLSTFMGYEQYNRLYENGGGPITFTLLIIGVFIICSVFKDQLIKIDSDFMYKYIALALSVVFLPLAFIDPSAMRVSYYYSLFLMVIISDVVEIFDKDQQTLITIGITVAMIALLISNNPQYTFFWME